MVLLVFLLNCSEAYGFWWEVKIACLIFHGMVEAFTYTVQMILHAALPGSATAEATAKDDYKKRFTQQIQLASG